MASQKALLRAAAACDVPAMRSLLHAGAAADAPDHSVAFEDEDYTGYTPMVEVLNSRASAACQAAAVQLLLSAGASVNRHVNRVTPLHRASHNDCGDSIFDMLVEAGARIEARDVDSGGHTPLHYAASGRVVRKLLALGAAIEARSDSGQTPLHVAVNWALSVSEALLDAGAAVEAVDAAGGTPLQRAMQLLECMVDAHHAKPGPSSCLAIRDARGATHVLLQASAWTRRRHAVAAFAAARRGLGRQDGAGHAAAEGRLTTSGES